MKPLPLQFECKDASPSLKFGDIVKNEWASEDNPQRIGILVRSSGRMISCTDGKGHFWEFNNDKHSRLIKIGSLDMQPYDRCCKWD